MKDISLRLLRSSNVCKYLVRKAVFQTSSKLFYTGHNFEKLTNIMFYNKHFRSTKCEYLDGSCLASPRWVSLLVAEIYYPDVSFPNPGHSHNRTPVKGASPPNVSFRIKPFGIYRS